MDKRKNALQVLEEQPYEKFIKRGPESLTDAELLAIILRTGTHGESAVNVGMKVLSLAGGNRGILGLHHLTLKDLMSVHGIGMVKAVKLKCVVELSNRISKATTFHPLMFNNPSTVAGYYMEQMRHLEVEQVILVMLDNKSHFMDDCIIAIGSVKEASLSPREVFKRALKQDAVNVLILHNHPSGDPTPSCADFQITKRIMEASKLVDIPLMDHIIIGDNKYVSFREKGYI